MKSILVPVEDGADLPAQLETTLLAAKPFGAHIDGVAPRPAADVYFYGDGVSPIALDQWQRDDEERAQRAQSAFRDFMRQRDVAWGDPKKPSEQPTADWLGDAVPGLDAIGQLARLYDVTVLAQPSPEASMPRSALLETILFESGHPILVTPPEAPAKLGEVVMIAWNGSTESARAVTMAHPFLTRASRVVVLSVEGGMVAGPDAGDVERTLCRAGIAAETNTVRPGSLTTGEAILAEADKAGADLLVKGAYTQSRLRQMIFGGATSHILSESKIPVLMAH